MQSKAIVVYTVVCVLLSGCAEHVYEKTGPVLIQPSQSFVKSTLLVAPVLSNRRSEYFNTENEHQIAISEQQAVRDQIRTIWRYDIQQDKRAAKNCFSTVLPTVSSTHSVAPATGSSWEYKNGSYTRVTAPLNTDNRRVMGSVGNCMNSFVDKLAEQEGQMRYLHAPTSVVVYLHNAREWARTCSVSGRRSTLCVNIHTINSLKETKSAAQLAIQSLQ